MMKKFNLKCCSSNVLTGQQKRDSEKSSELYSKQSLPTKSPNDDLALLPEISEQSLLSDLETRYRQGQIYTYIGDILIALNPFDLLPIYGRKISELYKNTQSIPSLSPHIYGCAERLYRSMLREKTSQCVVISGLSGSGKTESCKYIVQHILSRSLSIETALNIKINQVNPLMEAFGNAKTYINSNSSRFGKYLEIHFSPAGNVLGAHLKEYLLEKSRVISHNNHEGTFHIFYYLFAGLPHEILLRHGLRVPSEHRYMSHNDEFAHLDNARQMEYRKKFQMVRQSLVSIGFSTEDVQSIFTILAAILHVGDVSFVPHGSNDGVRVKNDSTIEKIADLLQLSSMDLSSALVTELQVTRGEQIFRERNIIQASECRDAFAKALYGRLFSWIVNGINSYLQPAEDQSSSAHTISVLDIFGFENFQSNSFEQLCINLTNEHMQRFLNQHLYDLEIYDCHQEGIETVDVNYADNHLVIETFLNKHSGILAILDEESRFPQATDQSLATKLHHGPGVQFSDIYCIPKDGGTTFTVRHYAAPVVYNIVGLLEKNRDFLPNSIVFVARTSNNLIMQELFRLNLNEKGIIPASPTSQQHFHHHPNTYHVNRDVKRAEPPRTPATKHSPYLQQPTRTLPEKTYGNTFERTGGTAMRTVAFHFKHSLSELIEKMNLCQCHFVRCIKPNGSREKTGSLTVPSVTRQLRYSGVLQMCEIRKKGFPLRIQFEEFLHRYHALVVCLLPINGAERSKELSLATSYNRDRAIECLKRAKIDNYKVGRTKLLFRYWHSDQLHNLAVDYERKAVVCQKVVRGWLARRKHARLHEVHQLQLAFIRKFSDDILSTSHLYRSKMDQHVQADRKRQQQQIQSAKNNNNDDDEQIERTLNFFDAILDPYLSDHDLPDEHTNRRLSNGDVHTKPVQPPSNGHHAQATRQDIDLNASCHTNTSSTSSSSSQKIAQRPVELQASHFNQFQNIRCRFEQMTSGSNSPSNNNVRRYTSENNLNAINAPMRPTVTPPQAKVARSTAPQPIATSTEDLTNIPSWKKLSPQARLSALLDKTNQPLTSNGTSASLIDLTSIDKMPTTKQIEPTSRPRFRFVPSSDQNSTLKEEPEPEQQPPSSHQSYDNFGLNSMSPNRAAMNNYQQPSSAPIPSKHTQGLVKPSVIAPTQPSQAPRSVPFHQSAAPEITLYHQNGTSAFRPHVNNHMNLGRPPGPMPSHPMNGNHLQRPVIATHNIIQSSGIIGGNGAPYKQTQAPPAPNVKRTESVHRPGVHVGITNPSGPPSTTGLLVRQNQQTAPQYHQSMLNLSAMPTSDLMNSNQNSPAMFASRTSLQTNAPNFMKHPAYASPSGRSPGTHQYQPPPPSSPRPPPTMHEDPILKWIQHVNNSSSINGLTHSSQNQLHINGGGKRPPPQQQQNYPYGSFISTGSGLPPSTNGSDYSHRPSAQQPYLSQVNVHKRHAPQHTVPVQSTQLSSPPPPTSSSSSGANIYHFSQGNGQQIPGPSGGGPLRHHAQRQDVTVTTYL